MGKGIPGYRLKLVPIYITMEANYKSFMGLLGALRRMPDSTIIIKGYSLQKDPSIAPRLSIRLSLEALFLREKKEE